MVDCFVILMELLSLLITHITQIIPDIYLDDYIENEP